MSGKKQKLELTWIGKENRARLEPRVLLDAPAKSRHVSPPETPRGLAGTVACPGGEL